ncbi:unnamed protein product [Sphenostylis stenocarpa]|uniref:Protein kinase domain-containing protein n=1 Tax=Sphenostylis stenocarpa TaxID=92480 RepID=A0AA86RU95_9FABA|nr:unnamed protein product [Sphenostylis stenocarpa]
MGVCFTSLARHQSPHSTSPHLGSATVSLETEEGKHEASELSEVGESTCNSNSNSIVFPSVEMRTLKEFNFAELKAATKSFKSDALLGEGGFGKDGPSRVAGTVSHPNLVKLLGYCCEDMEFLLVYEFMPKGSLENHLFWRNNNNTQALSWDTRLKIAIGAARGLAYLHTSEKQIIYRDFKASNILLDEEYNAKISDFGLAKLGPSAGDSHVTTRIIGTYGYAAPEYIATGHLYVKSDVYGFGVVLLEMLKGMRALDTNRPPGHQNLVEWIKPFLSDKTKLKSDIMDERIEGQYSTMAALKAAQLTLKCLESDPKKRPSMKEVLDTLETIQTINVRRREKKKHISKFATTNSFQ